MIIDDDLRQEMYTEHKCQPLHSSAAGWMGRSNFKAEQKRRKRDRERCDKVVSWYTRAVTEGYPMSTADEAVKSVWAVLPFLVRIAWILWQPTAEALIKWLWERSNRQ